MRLLLPLLPLFLCWLTSCSQQISGGPAPTALASYLTTSDGKQLSLRHWNLQSRPQTVLIGLHGIEGAASDYGNLGKTLPQQSPRTTLYALNLRGAGYDEDLPRQGDIGKARLWIRDLVELDAGLRARHPEARIVWVGESMGALIALKAAAQSEAPPNGLVLVSPVVSLDSIPGWQLGLLRLAARLTPWARVSLETLAGGSFQATTSSNHFSQSETNPYHVESYTLRFLNELAQLSEESPRHADKVTAPTLILHGGKDFLSNPRQISNFANDFSPPATLLNFPQSHHLLFYDKERDAVVSELLDWVNEKPQGTNQHLLD
ncbi:alpha/beta fold hydrolase [Roseibacillus persicicus]|uniref:alpha/beta hydrolase n=1 Tax=Roseibacillus persicicus TaxID=454148 RepID=UPI00398B4903